MSGTALIDVVDLEQVVKDYALEFLDKEQRRLADTKNPEVEWQHVYIKHGDTQYSDLVLGSPQAAPKSHVLFSAHFTNNTEKPQTYTLRTERRTRSTCELSLNKAYTIGASVELKLVPPNPIIEANAGFHGELSMAKGVTEVFEEELTWSVDSNIEVPSNFATQADLVIKEEQFSGQFSIETEFQGRIHVTYINKKDQSHITTVTDDVKKIFGKEKGFKVFKNDPEKPGVYFTTFGSCKCRFGMEQHVRLTQKPLAEMLKNGSE